jgi:hypothetical protein
MMYSGLEGGSTTELSATDAYGQSRTGDNKTMRQMWRSCCPATYLWSGPKFHSQPFSFGQQRMGRGPLRQAFVAWRLLCPMDRATY